jgi:hypothetical protein
MTGPEQKMTGVSSDVDGVTLSTSDKGSIVTAFQFHKGFDVGWLMWPVDGDTGAIRTPAGRSTVGMFVQRGSEVTAAPLIRTGNRTGDEHVIGFRTTGGKLKVGSVNSSEISKHLGSARWPSVDCLPPGSQAHYVAAFQNERRRLELVTLRGPRDGRHPPFQLLARQSSTLPISRRVVVRALSRTRVVTVAHGRDGRLRLSLWSVSREGNIDLVANSGRLWPVRAVSASFLDTKEPMLATSLVDGDGRLSVECWSVTDRGFRRLHFRRFDRCDQVATLGLLNVTGSEGLFIAAARRGSRRTDPLVLRLLRGPSLAEEGFLEIEGPVRSMDIGQVVPPPSRSRRAKTVVVVAVEKRDHALQLISLEAVVRVPA